MRVIGKKELYEFAQQHRELAPQIDAWISEVTEAEWKSPLELKERYPQASILPMNQFIFNLKGNQYRLLATVSFKTGTVLIERIGTHAQYSRWKFQ
jgi:mRNA interferase HigB